MILNARWTAGATTPEARLERYRTLCGSRHFVELLQGVLKNVRDELEREMVAAPDYRDVAWPYKQAHINGGLAVLDQISKKILPSDLALKELQEEVTRKTNEV